MYFKFQVASDESDYELDEDNSIKDKRKITLQLLKKWQEEIQKDKYYLIKYYRNYLIIIESKNILIIDLMYVFIYDFSGH